MEEVPFGRFGFIKKNSLDWIVKNFSLIGTCSLIAIVGFVSFSRWMKKETLRDYLAVEETYRQWDGKMGTKFFDLQKCLKEHPKLHDRYDGMIAHKLLASSETDEIQTYGKGAIERLKGFSPYYRSFSETTLLIADKKFAEALEEAKKLKIAMEKDDPFWAQEKSIIRYGSSLYAFNLLRIATLEGSEAGTPEGELLAWECLKKQAHWVPCENLKETSKTYDPEAYEKLKESFQNNTVSLIDYIHHREEILQKTLSH